MRKPNLLYVFADQWRTQSIGIHDESVKTPRMDEFAHDAVDIKECVSTHPLCSPYRACLFTGQYPTEHGVYGNCMTGYPIALSEEKNMLDIFADDGYRTGYIGKWHLDEPDLNHSDAPVSGARNWDAFTPPGPKRHGIEYWHAYNADNDHLHPHYWEDTPEKINVDQWSPEYETNLALDFITRCGDDPFALFLSWNPPHSPYSKVPKELLDLYPEDSIELRGNYEGEGVVNHTGEPDCFSSDEMMLNTREYLAAISGLDREFGRLIDYLKERNLYDDTLIILTSDHGDMMGSHRLIGKHVWYDESIGVPFLMRYGDRFGRGCRSMQFSTLNIMPTVLSAMNLPVPSKYRDNDRYAEIKEDRIPENDASYIYCQVSRDVFIEAWKEVGISPLESGWRCVKTGEWKLVVFRGYLPSDKPEILLYDRTNDPLEMSPIVLSDGLGENKIAQDLCTMLLENLDKHDPGFASWLRNYIKV